MAGRRFLIIDDGGRRNSSVGDDAGMSDPSPRPLMYGELAEWWPLLSPPEDYAEDADTAAALLASADGPVRDVLELGSGGGSNAVHLKARFDLTLTDVSAPMLAVSRRLNPECDHRVGDMREVRLGRTFDAVFIHDAIEYMTTEDDLRRAIATAHVHCRPGGVAVLVPDHTAESFAPATEHGGIDASDGRGARYLAWTWDPDPADTTITTDYAFLLRSADGTTRAAHDTHHTGLYPRATWLRLLAEAGFRAGAVREQTAEPRIPREFFVGHRPAATASTPEMV